MERLQTTGEADGHADDVHEYKPSFDSGIDEAQDADTPQAAVQRNSDPPVLEKEGSTKSKKPDMRVTREALKRTIWLH